MDYSFVVHQRLVEGGEDFIHRYTHTINLRSVTLYPIHYYSSITAVTLLPFSLMLAVMTRKYYTF